VAIETREDSKAVIVGYASIFFDGTHGTEYVLWDDSYGRAVERVLPGAFDAALARPDDVAGLFNHDPNLVLGRTSAGTTRLSVDPRGLRYEIEPGDTSVGRDVIAHVRRRDVAGSSFAFSVPDGGQRWTAMKDGQGRMQEIREILSVELWDVSPVTFPAYVGTSAGLRDRGGVDEARESWRRYQGRLRKMRARAVEVDAG
jgi:hypothetical protein